MTSKEIQILADELSNDPLSLGYASMADEQAADALNAKSRVRQQPIPMTSVMRWAAKYDALYRLEQQFQSSDASVRGVARAAAAMISSPHVTSLDLTDPEIQSMMESLVQAGVFTQTEVDDLVARGQETISRAEELGLGLVKPGHIQMARSI